MNPTPDEPTATNALRLRISAAFPDSAFDGSITKVEGCRSKNVRFTAHCWARNGRKFKRLSSMITPTALFF